MATPRRNPVFIAIDTGNLDRALHITEKVKTHVGGIKLGLEFFLAQGVAGYQRIAAIGLPIFLDLKLHDIPNTVAKAITSLLPLNPAFLTIHGSGGAAMMRAAADAARATNKPAPKLLGVTVLTSLDGSDLTAVGQPRDSAEQVLRLAQLAQASELDGVICSPQEVEMLRRELGPDFILMVPGIRPAVTERDDQKRTLTPAEAMTAGATHLVIGRPITAADNPTDAARAIAVDLGL